MSTSIHSTKCKQQVSGNSVGRSLSFIRQNSSNGKSNSANRRSAVERLEESKANYVKTESVLDCKQQFKHSSHLHVSTGPQLDVLLKAAPLKSLQNCQSAKLQDDNINSQENCIDDSTFMRDAFPPKVPVMLATRTKPQGDDKDSRTRKKASLPRNNSDLSDEGVTDLETQLRTLLSSSSKENINLSSNKQSVNLFKMPDRTSEKRNSVEDNCDPSQNNNWKVTKMQENNCQVQINAPDHIQSLSKNEHSGSEGHSSACSKESLSAEDITELEDKYPCSRTSDYVSRSSSFKCAFTSDRVRTLVNSFESRMNKDNGLSTVTVSKELPEAGEKRRPVSRSKSDVSHRFSKGLEVLPKRNGQSNSELERFFDTMGLDTTVWHHLTAPPASPAHFFDSISSLNSEDHRSSICSEDSATETHKEGLTNRDLQKHAPTETSIVEKNARVIKWLYNCRKAYTETAS